MIRKTFEEFIAQFPKCTIQSYEIAKAAWEEQQKLIDHIHDTYREEIEAWDDDSKSL